MTSDLKNKRRNEIKEAIMNLLHSSAQEGSQYVTFYLGDEEYGIPIKYIQEIIAYKSVTFLPNTKKCMKGILNLRGDVVPVMDLRMIFDLPTIEYGVRSIIVILRMGEKRMGLLVDHISDVLTIENHFIDHVPDMSTSINENYIEGIGKVSDSFLILLNVEKIFPQETQSKQILDGEL